ncbi:hypothetical protein JOB18_025778 [Solea senegalensis]|uniref:Uncharacterized protein n=1 Tax=Solea senegalensis TaxID=28829 RepID=A0AAV6SUH6_SOLSE|nr:hypothetical protein JOB18_025778 [Solea senegalensis]
MEYMSTDLYINERRIHWKRNCKMPNGVQQRSSLHPDEIQETGSYEYRKRSGAMRVTAKTDNKHCIVTSQRVVKNSTTNKGGDQHCQVKTDISDNCERHLKKAGLKGCISAKKKNNTTRDMSGQKHTKM